MNSIDAYMELSKWQMTNMKSEMCSRCRGAFGNPSLLSSKTRRAGSVQHERFTEAPHVHLARVIRLTYYFIGKVSHCIIIGHDISHTGMTAKHGKDWICS